MKLTVERKNAEPNGWKNSHSSGVILDQRASPVLRLGTTVL